MKLIEIIAKYGLTTTIKKAMQVAISKIKYGRNIRIIKSCPRIIRIGDIFFGEKFTAGIDIRLESLAEESIINFGKNVKINDYCHIGAITSITIGDDCLIGSRVTIVDHEHGFYGNHSNDSLTPSHPDTPPDARPLSGAPIVIEQNTWIGEGAVILAGVKIGKGCIIGANAVVTRDIPPYSIAVGIPAKIIKVFNEETGSWEKA